MNWNEYVGERFLCYDKKTYEAESYCPTREFIFIEVGNPGNRKKVAQEELGKGYWMIIDVRADKITRSIKDSTDAFALMDRIQLAMDMKIPIPEICKTYSDAGYSQWDIYLTIKGIELLSRNK